jgi:NTE family protein
MEATRDRRHRRSAGIRRPISLALQGGGSFGAYTWGVLDALLTSRSVAIAQLSGTSAGAINAAIVAGALAKGSASQARAALRSFWLSIAEQPMAHVPFALLRPLERQWRSSVNAWLQVCDMPPAGAFNSFAVEFLRSAIAAHVDIDAIRSKSAPALFVTVTAVKTGLPRVISNDAMSVEALVASASLPDLFPAVEMDGEWYWDGGYGGNPTLWPMIHSNASSDVIVVQLMRDRVDELPTGTAAIRRRVSEIVFNSSLVAEVQSISAMRAALAKAAGGTATAAVRLHRIGPPRLELFDQGTAADRAPSWLELLHDEGSADGKRFMARHGSDIGVRETLDVARAFVGTNKPRIPMRASGAPSWQFSSTTAT